jgi:hypothetical protein
MTMRWILALVVAMGGAFVFVTPAKAAAPDLMSYQGVLVQNDGIAVPDGVYDLRFRMFDQQSAGMLLFEQTLSAQVVHGLYNVILSTNGGYDLRSVVTGNPQLFIEVTVLASPPAVPGDVTLLPRQQLASVPFALSETSGLVSAQTKRNSTPTTISTGGVWTTPPDLLDLTIEVPSSACVVEVEARVALGTTGSSSTVGVRIEERIDSGQYAVVAGDAIVEAEAGTAETASLSYVLASPTVASYTYRVQTREDTTNSYTINPVLGSPSSLYGDSVLSGKLWCP